jgi:HSF-type DNA-binding
MEHIFKAKHNFLFHIFHSTFRQTKYSSFQRQLNIYGFKRISSGPDQHAYYHEHFLRGEYTSTLTIKRIALKGTGARLSTNREDEPNFYQMPYKLDERQAKQRTSTASETSVPLPIQASEMKFDITAKFSFIPKPVVNSYTGADIIVRPFVSHDFTMAFDPSQWHNYRAETEELRNQAHVLRDGYPIAQLYAMGADFIDPINQAGSSLGRSTVAGPSSDLLRGTQFRPLFREPYRDLTIPTVSAILREQALIEAIQGAFYWNA